MKTFSMQHRTPLVAVIVFFACDTQPNGSILAPSFRSFANSEWSAPVHLGPEINSPFADNNPTLSSDELTMYFASDRPGGLGLVDIWVTRRASRDSPWEPPANLGPPVNTPFIDGAPSLSAAPTQPPGRRSRRAVGAVLREVHVARRPRPHARPARSPRPRSRR